MDVTFGICVSPTANIDHLQNQIWSIQDQIDYGDNIQVVLCGTKHVLEEVDPAGLDLLFFDETEKPGWITRKKNLMVQKSLGDIIVLTHDYYMFDEEWLKGFKIFDKKNPNWQVAVNPIWTAEGARHSDWLINPKYMDQLLIKHPELASELMSVAHGENGPRWVCGLDYSENLSKFQYVSGGMIIAKRNVLLDVPLNEDLVWGQAEDVEWSERLVAKYPLTFNPYSFNGIQKPGKWHCYEMTEKALKKLKVLYNE